MENELKIKQVSSKSGDFKNLCLELQNYQHTMLPQLAQNGYTLTNDLDNIKAFVMYNGNNAIGSIGLRQVDNERCEIVRVFVYEKYRGRGYASMLFAKIEQYACELGYKNAEMVTWSASKSALALYKKMGYSSSEEKISDWFKGLGYIELYKNLQKS